MPPNADQFSPEQLKDVFSRALEHAPAERAHFLQQACAESEPLRRAAQELLHAHEEATGFLDRPTLLPTASIDAEPMPQQIGPFAIVKLLGEGGFGSVYLAEQASPVQRRVAVKVLKPGMDSRQILARFNAERQTLALMDHPNIARVIDAGVTEAGRPYFVMEFVDGVPITQYCDDRTMTANARLALFASVCNAVHHAHQKGIIHRDIKPSNVMVTEIDGVGVAKVIDFGVSKAIEQVSGLTMMTDTRQLIGTPEYMSPEQARLEGNDVDTRSDVYSLGVLLYELLTGTTPFDSASLRAAALFEMQRMIREVEPPKPSTRVLQAKSPEIVAARRRTELRRLASAIRGELDWIVMKCLEKDRTGRYESAASLSRDIDNYLGGRPIYAGPPSALYRFRKFVRRNRVPVAAGAVAAGGLVMGFIISILAWRQASTERDNAATARDLAQQHSQFVSSMFLSIRPEVAQGREITVREVLDDAVARVEGAFAGMPKVEIEVRNTFGQAYASIGQLDRARQQFEAAIRTAGDPAQYADPGVLLMYANYGDALKDAGEQEQALPTLRRAVNGLAREVGDGDLRTLSAKLKLASLLFKMDQLQDAESIHEQISARLNGDESPEALQLMLANLTTFAVVKHQKGKFGEAAALYQRAREIASKTLSNDHPDLIAMTMGYSSLLRDEGKFSEALGMVEPAFRSAQRIFGEDHPNTLIMAHHVGLLMSANGRAADARTLLDDSLVRCKKVFGNEHPTTIYTWHDWFQTRTLSRKYVPTDDDIASLSELIAIMRRKLGENHRDTLMTHASLARLVGIRGDLDAATAIYSDVLEKLRKTYGNEHHYTLSVELRLGQNLSNKGDNVAAEPLLAHAYEVSRKSESTIGDWSSPGYYGICLANLGKYEAAVPMLLEAEAAMRRYRKLDVAMMRNVARTLDKCYRELGQLDTAKSYAGIALEMEAQLATTQPVVETPTR